jgi:hypothetical protein
MSVEVDATDPTTILDPVLQARLGSARRASDLALTAVDRAAVSEPVEASKDASDAEASSSIAGAVTAPDWSDAGLPTAQRFAMSGDESSDARTVGQPGHIDLGIGTRAELDRRIQQAADAWFAPQPHSTDIALSHFDEITRGVLHANIEDGNGAPFSERSVSYARDWQKVRARKSSFEVAGTEASWGWDAGSAALARGGRPSGATSIKGWPCLRRCDRTTRRCRSSRVCRTASNGYEEPLRSIPPRRAAADRDVAPVRNGFGPMMPPRR